MSSTSATHPIAPEEVMALLDGELSAEQAEIAWAHVGPCAECASVAEGFRQASHILPAWQAEPIPESVASHVGEMAARIRSGAKVRHKDLFVRLSFWNLRNWALVGGATAVTLLVLVAIATPNLLRPKPSLREKDVSETEGEPLGFSSADPVAAAKPKQLGNDTSTGAVAFGSGRGMAPSAAKARAVQDVARQPMIARTALLAVVVKDFAASRVNLDAILGKHRGYAAELTANTAENAPRMVQASLRVPAPELDAAIRDLKALGRVEKESQNGEEVTQQHADLVARLRNSRETEQRLQTILVQRTGKIRDVLEVEQEIARVRGEIEQMEAEQESLEHRVEFATVNLSLTEEYKAQLSIPAISAGTRLHNALVEGYRHASETVLGMALFLAEYTLTLLIWGVILLAPAILLWRRFQRAMATV